MRIDLHNHTTRCNHAEGTVDEYVRRAIELGIDVYGFSEHAPMDFDPGYRLDFDEMSAYTSDVLAAKEQYKDKIKILLAYEVDYLPGYMDARILDAKADYLIGSVHFLDKWGFDNPEFIGGYKDRDINEIWQAYFDASEAMAKTGYFDIVGHFDLMKVFKYMPTKDIRLLASKALKAIKKSNMVLEINTAGLRKPVKEIYPSELLLIEAHTLDIPITFGSDAHGVDQVGFAYDKAVALAKRVGYTKVVTFEQRDRELVNF